MIVSYPMLQEIYSNYRHAVFSKFSFVPHDGDPESEQEIEAPEPEDIVQEGLSRLVRNGGAFESPVYMNVTWRVVMDEMEKSIEALQDFHHVYMEGVRILPSQETLKGEVVHKIEIATGS